MYGYKKSYLAMKVISIIFFSLILFGAFYPISAKAQHRAKVPELVKGKSLSPLSTVGVKTDSTLQILLPLKQSVADTLHPMLKVFTPDSLLTRSMPIIAPPKVDEKMVIPKFLQKSTLRKRTFNKPNR